MSMPFYVAPEQFMKDKADFARKNVGRGRPLVAVVFSGGVLVCAENPSRSLNKISEIYDRIAFAGVGRYNEFDQLRRSGVQYADVQGYQFSREDVDARSLANLYAQYMGNVFTHEMKPLEVEILVAEVGAAPADDQLFHIHYDGVVQDEVELATLGGEAESIAGRLRADFDINCSLAEAVRACVSALAGPDRSLSPGDLEVALLDRSETRRAFRRIEGDELAEILAVSEETSGAPEREAD
jgi:proteasome alpha subunit